MRFVLAFSSFFRLLFGAKLHRNAAKYLPEGALALTDGTDGTGDSTDKADEADKADKTEKAKKAEKVEKPKPKAPSSGADRARHHKEGALAMLALLQREGRLVDFLKESIDDYDDSDIGAAVRDIHRGCSKVLGDYLTLEAVMPGDEDDDVKVPAGFDPSEIRLVGETNGDPPFAGVLRHHGWRVSKAKLPALSDGVDRAVLAPAEVEVE